METRVDRMGKAMLADERMLRIVMLRELEGRTFKEIGSSIGVCWQSAAMIYHKAMSIKARNKTGEDDPYFGLSVRAANCCNNAGLMTRLEIESAIKDGRLHPKNKSRCIGYGKKIHIEIQKWLGIHASL